MTNSKFNLAAALETLRRTKRSALDKLLMDTLLLKSAAEGNVALVDAVLSDGADINAKDSIGCSSLHLAAFNGQTATAELLIAKAAAIDVKDRDGWTPLHYAAHYGCIATAELLRAKGAIDVKDRDGWTPRHHAACYGAVRRLSR